MNQTMKILITGYLGIGVDECTEETYVDQLEALIEKANAYAREGKELFPDATYDTCIDFLRSVKPDSPVLHQVWSGDDETVEFDKDIDRYLVEYPMLSIQTIKDIDDPVVDNFIAKMPEGDTLFNFTLKENGHGIRIVCVYGEIVKATSRGRSTNGRDLTTQVKRILGDSIEGLADLAHVELRGEVLLPFRNLDRAKEYNPDIKSAFSGVSSMLRDSATEDETKLLEFVAYDILTDEKDFYSLTEKIMFLDEVGLITPYCIRVPVSKANFKQQILYLLDNIAQRTMDYDYYTDGVVAAIDDNALFGEFGAEDKFRLGNLAFKIGRWEQNVYCGRVSEVKWKPGKNKLSPVCVVEDPDTGEEGVLTATGNRVKNVPVYAPCHILTLGAYIGELIYFKYGGEAGVVPCTSDGILVTDKTQMQMESSEITDEDFDALLDE